MAFRYINEKKIGWFREGGELRCNILGVVYFACKRHGNKCEEHSSGQMLHTFDLAETEKEADILIPVGTRLYGNWSATSIWIERGGRCFKTRLTRQNSIPVVV